MIQEFVDRFMAKEDYIKAKLAEGYPKEGYRWSYEGLVKMFVEAIQGVEYEGLTLDPERITVIDHGHYQGTLVFVIAEKGYQPFRYYAFENSYGSCSGCDTLQNIDYGKSYKDDDPMGQVRDLWTLMLHMVQRLKEVGRDAEG